jgi:PAS domain S-box-containing protein
LSNPSSRSIRPPEYPYAYIVENIRAAIGISENGLHRYGNRAYLDLFGYAANEELVGKPFMEQIAPGARKALRERIAKRSDDVAEERYETMGFKKDGSEFPMEVLVNIVRNESGQFAVAFFSDISSEKQNIATIRESAALLSAIVNSTSHFIWAVDAKSFGLTYFNGKLAEYFLKKRGIRLELGMLPEQLFTNAEDARPGIRSYERTLAQGSLETDYTNFDGTLHLNLHYTRLMGNNEATGIAVFGEDVTQKVHAQRRLSESESLYRVLADNALAGVYFVQDGKIAYANKTLSQMFGYENGELVGQDPLMLFHPDDRSIMRQRRSRRLEGATEAAEYEARCLRKDGSIRQIFLSVSSAVYESKPAVIVLMRDITEAKKAEEELRRSEAMFRTLSENAMVGVYVLQNGKFVYVNKRLAEMFGYEPDELVGKETLSIIHPDDHAFAAENRQRRADGRVDDVEYEIRGVRKDKTTIILGVAASGAEFLGRSAVIVVMRDITESKHVEESLRDSEARFRTLSENSLVGVYMSQHFKLAYVNRTFAQIFGRTPTEMIGLDLPDVVYPDDWQLVSESLQPDGDGALTKSEFEVRIQRYDGEVRTVAATASAAVINGRPLTIGVMRDVTESKQAEQNLCESEAMFRTLSEDSMAGVYFSQDEKFAYANKTLANIFGYEPEELLG